MLEESLAHARRTGNQTIGGAHRLHRIGSCSSSASHLGHRYTCFNRKQTCRPGSSPQCNRFLTFPNPTLSSSGDASDFSEASSRGPIGQQALAAMSAHRTRCTSLCRTMGPRDPVSADADPGPEDDSFGEASGAPHLPTTVIPLLPGLTGSFNSWRFAHVGRVEPSCDNLPDHPWMFISQGGSTPTYFQTNA